jgi:hypothetical protein
MDRPNKDRSFVLDLLPNEKKAGKLQILKSQHHSKPHNKPKVAREESARA